MLARSHAFDHYSPPHPLELPPTITISLHHIVHRGEEPDTARSIPHLQPMRRCDAVQYIRPGMNAFITSTYRILGMVPVPASVTLCSYASPRRRGCPPSACENVYEHGMDVIAEQESGLRTVGTGIPFAFHVKIRLPSGARREDGMMR